MFKAKLVVIGGAKTAEIALSLPTIIGRGRDANLTLPHPLISRQHCELFEKEGMLNVRDLQSLNGTYVDNLRIETSSILKPDQLLTIGSVTFRAIYSSEDASVAEPSENVSNVIEFESVPSLVDSDIQIDGDQPDSVHSRPTVPGRRPSKVKCPPAAANVDPLQTIHAEDIENHFADTSDLLDGYHSDDSPVVPRHSVVAAMQDAGVSPVQPDEPSISDIRSQLPDESRSSPGNVEGLVVDPAQSPAAKAEFSSIELDEHSASNIDSDESALGSFIRKLPR